MKNSLILLIITTLFLFGCASSIKQLQRGDYDAAIRTAVRNLRVDPTNQEEIKVLDRAYTLANETDLERIQYLELEGNPRSWDELFNLYSDLRNRQAAVRTVLPLELNGRIIDYPHQDYDSAIIEAKQRAADYYWGHAHKLMDNDTKESYRQAYGEFRKVKKYIGDYENIDQLLQETRWLGISRAFISLFNNTHLKLSDNYKIELLSFGPQDLNSEWVEYHTKRFDADLYYDYFIHINLNRINVSPEKVVEKDRMETKEIEDGWEYVLDDRGNVVKDSSGNDIKVKKFRTAACSVIETRQYKEAFIKGEIEIIQNEPRQVIKSIPISAESIFEHVSARAIGDTAALSHESKAMIKADQRPFPHDLDLIHRSSNALKLSIRKALRNNRRYLD
ncbi:MAG: hypothetical protein V3U16_09085 [Candidatus Neomarinimicrobiota bacterium]